ncbi:MAG: type II toxin-antitoxin system PemK/MazF family toxin [Paludisphaera borealis]|uniref:type II toxin-antitoxin system PemK/MazF family toxin n=1 Tax=Paludisphaera borealis TaxID=1387353 RepID=UPI002850F575|nr:type II toxin-antitoxin system PemK/MazF family toxin [Paludisphaera borealis]MDR3623418.1 type II toxin-antitoxin system PemK/MazF family toxin [Paludisphaera borealis]
MDRAEDPRLTTYSGLISQGDLYWIEPDETRGSVPGRPHPYVVVQDDLFNRSRISTIIVCALTSNLNRATEPGNVLLEPGEGDLDKQSVIVVGQVSCLYKTRLGTRIGALSSERIEQVLAGMRFQQTFFDRR